MQGRPCGQQTIIGQARMHVSSADARFGPPSVLFLTLLIVSELPEAVQDPRTPSVAQGQNIRQMTIDLASMLRQLVSR